MHSTDYKYFHVMVCGLELTYCLTVVQQILAGRCSTECFSVLSETSVKDSPKNTNNYDVYGGSSCKWFRVHLL